MVSIYTKGEDPLNVRFPALNYCSRNLLPTHIPDPFPLPFSRNWKVRSNCDGFGRMAQVLAVGLELFVGRAELVGVESERFAEAVRSKRR